MVVTAITPTPLGEGKSTTTVGLAQGLNAIGRKAAVCIRQPSLGPVFGIKGGAAGGGYSQVIPMEDFNLHLTGDVHAIGAAHNLAAAFLDNHLHQSNCSASTSTHPLAAGRRHQRPGRPTGGDRTRRPRERRAARDRVGHHGRVGGHGGARAGNRPARPARARLGRIVMATTTDGTPVTCEDLGVAGSMTVLLIDAIKPNLLQTLEGGPAFVHCGPFANIAHGNNSIIADRLALATNEIVCTEAGFGADMGAEKFFDIKCRASGLRPDAAVVVPPSRAEDAWRRRQDRGRQAARPGAARGERRGRAGRWREPAKQIENVRLFNVPVVVAINAFPPTPRRRSRRSGKSRWRRAPATRSSRRTSPDGPRRHGFAEAVWDAAEEGAPAFQLSIRTTRR